MAANPQHPVFTIVVEADGHLLIASNGQVSGPADLVKVIKENALLGEWFRLTYPHGAYVQADLTPDNHIGIAAALSSVAPGRARILEAPVEVFEFLDRDAEGQESYLKSAAQYEEQELTDVP